MQIKPETKKRIAALIDQRRLKLAPIAQKIGTSYSTLWNFVHGETRNFGKIRELLEVLGVSLDWLQKEGDFFDSSQRFSDNVTKARFASEHGYKNDFQNTMSLSTGIDLAIKAAIQDKRKPSEDVLNFVRESLYRVAVGSKKPLTESEFIEYARGFLAMRK